MSIFEKIEKSFATESGKRNMGYVYGFGAAFVLVGALFKLTHPVWAPGWLSNALLGGGLGVEALIFILSSFEKPHMEPNWDNIVKEIKDAIENKANNPSTGSNFNGLGDLDADFAKLKQSIETLNVTAKGMSDLGNAVSATKVYAEAMNNAANSVNSLNTQLACIKGDKLQTAMSTYITALENANNSAGDLQKKMTEMSKNMESLNKVYGGMLNAMGK